MKTGSVERVGDFRRGGGRGFQAGRINRVHLEYHILQQQPSILLEISVKGHILEKIEGKRLPTGTCLETRLCPLEANRH